MPGADSPVSGKPSPTAVHVAPSSSEYRPRSAALRREHLQRDAVLRARGQRRAVLPAGRARELQHPPVRRVAHQDELRPLEPALACATIPAWT